MPDILIDLDCKFVQRHAQVRVGDIAYERGDTARVAMEQDEVPVTVAQFEAFKQMEEYNGICLVLDESGRFTVLQ